MNCICTHGHSKQSTYLSKTCLVLSLCSLLKSQTQDSSVEWSRLPGQVSERVSLLASFWLSVCISPASKAPLLLFGPHLQHNQQLYSEESSQKTSHRFCHSKKTSQNSRVQLVCSQNMTDIPRHRSVDYTTVTSKVFLHCRVTPGFEI